MYAVNAASTSRGKANGKHERSGYVQVGVNARCNSVVIPSLKVLSLDADVAHVVYEKIKETGVEVISANVDWFVQRYCTIRK